jgi:hypothetical protein
MDPNVAFSLAEFWTRTSFGEANMPYVLFPAFAYEDPRPGKERDPARQSLVEKALSEVSQRFDPDWDLFEAVLLLFEGQVDMFGGGAYAVPTRAGSDRTTISAAVVDQFSPFGSICQELGHAFGYDHELAMPSRAEYGSPYSSMSAETWPNHFDRPANANYTNLPSAAVGQDEPLRHVGPYITPAHFVASGSPTLNHPGSVLVPTNDIQQAPWPLRLVALDRAIADWPSRRPVIAVIPPYSPGARTYYIEVRRRMDYDRELSFGVSGRADAGLVIHSWEPQTGRIGFEGALAFDDQMGDRDYRSFSGWFIVRVLGWDPVAGEATLRIYGGENWRQFAVDFDGLHVDTTLVAAADWNAVEASPCGKASAGIYKYRAVTTTTEVLTAAMSYGFERPVYRWYLNGRELVGSNGSFALELTASKVHETSLVNAGTVNCATTFWATGNRMRLHLSSPYAGMNLELKAVVSESSREVVQNAYPDRTISTSLRIDNVGVEWDDRYQTEKLQCWRRYWHLDKGFKPGQVKLKRDPRPKWMRPEEGVQRYVSQEPNGPGSPAESRIELHGLLEEALQMNARKRAALAP